MVGNSILSAVINYLNLKIQQTYKFEKLYGLTEHQDKRYTHYIGDGQAVHVTDFDRYNGTIFWLRVGNPSYSRAANQVNPCEFDYQFVTTIRVVAHIHKRELNCDSASANDALAMALLPVITDSGKQLKTALGAKMVFIEPVNYNVKVPDIKHDMNYACIMSDYRLTIIGSPECFKTDALCVVPTPPGCAAASYIVRNQEGAQLASGNIPSGGSQIIVVECGGGGPCENATWELRDSEGNTLQSGQIPSGGNQIIIAPDANITINGTAFGSVPSGGLLDIPVQQDGNPIGSLVGGVWVIPDCPVTPCDDSTFTLENTLGTNLDSGSIPSGGSDVIIAPDATYDLEDADGNTISSGAIPSGANAVIVVPQTPIVAANLAGHYDYTGLVANINNAFGNVSAGGAISQLNDLSGNGRDFAQATGGNQPAIQAASNSLNAGLYSGSQWLNQSDSTYWRFLHNGSDFEVWMVVRAGSVANPNAAYGLLGNNAFISGNVGFNLVFEDRAGTNNRINTGIFRGVAGVINSVGVVVQDNILIPNQLVLVRVWYHLSLGTILSAVAQGAGGSTFGINSGWSAADSSFQLQQGAVGNNAFPANATQIQELAIFDAALTPAQVCQMCKYFNEKLGV